MNWTKFNTHSESCNHAFEVMCNLIFESWCKREYEEKLDKVIFVNGSGGDGGVEAYATLTDGSIVGVQSKWFRDKIENSQFKQIESSFTTAISVRPGIKRYIVCIPRDLNSCRMVKGGGVSHNTEEDKWNKLIKSLKDKAPNVVVELWNETRIQEMFTWPELLGIYKFWFGDGVFFNDTFELSYKKAICSWAKTKYIPDLYSEGYVHRSLDLFLGSYERTERRYAEWCKMYDRLMKLKRSFEDLLTVGLPYAEKKTIDKIKNDIVTISEWIVFLDRIEELVKNGLEITISRDFELECTIDIIKNGSFHLHRYFHINSVEKLLEDVVCDFYDFKKIFYFNNSNKLILLGAPGTGKTTAICAEISSFLENKIHLPILVHAKEFSAGDTWGSILGKTLGLAIGCDENEILYSLQCSAQLRKMRMTGEYDVVSNCVICVDGIDEAESWGFWKMRIDEVDAYKEIYPRIKFVFLSRPYVFDNDYKFENRRDITHIPYYGDVSPEILCEDYFEKYKISVGTNRTIKKLLRTPIAVRLFCDIYKGKDVEKIDKNTIILTKLFRKKIELLEKSFSDHVGYSYNGNVQTILCELAQLFTQNKRLSEKELTDKIEGVTVDCLHILLVFLKEEGFIYSFQVQKDDFSPVITYYSWGMQPAFDYLIARKLFVAIEQNEKIEIKYTNGIYEMLSLIIIEEKGKLLSEYTNIEIDKCTLVDLICYTLSSASVNVVELYCDYFKKLISCSTYLFRKIVNQVIIPVSSIKEHPLGSIFLDDFLRSFKNSAERDIWWSIPGYLIDNYDASWIANVEINFEEIKLQEDDEFDTLPIVLAWSLSSVNEDVRKHSRMELIKWSIHNQKDFWRLLLRFSDVDDEQILENLFAVAFGVALYENVEDDYIKVASTWIVENVFTSSGLTRFKNSAIRYYCSSIAKIAVAKGIKENSMIKIVTPPYSYNMEVEQLAIEAISAERMSGYNAISYDLARYVLCDHFDDFFRKNYKKRVLEDDSANFIEKYKLRYDIETLKVDGLIISMAYQYLKSNGWTYETFWQHDNSENLGVDIVIRHSYYPSTHGNKSRIMSVAEKNVWLARHRLECVFANEMVYRDYVTDSEECMLDDYSYMENFINPYQDYVNDKNNKKVEQWYHTELLAELKAEVIDDKAIEYWMNDNTTPDFKTWIFDNNGMMIVDAFTNVLNDFAGVEEAIWISTGIVEKNNFDKLIQCVQTYSEERVDLISADGFHAYQDSRSFCTPQEACTVRANKEVESSVFFDCNDEVIEVKTVSTRCLSSHETYVEKTFYLPSSYIREITGITFGDGFVYRNNEGDDIALFTYSGKNWGTQQEALLIDKDTFLDSLDNNGYKPFWVFRTNKSPSSKMYERYPEILHNTDVTYFVWLDEDIEYMVLEELQPPPRDFENTGEEVIQHILDQLNHTNEEKQI